MRNQPKYNLFKNSKYALDGLKSAIKNETSFKLELFFAIFILLGIWLVEVPLSSKLILLISGVLVLIVELINSAIENVVDLHTKEFHILAKNAKDIGSAAVMLSIILHLVCWFFILVF